jgi:membrane protease YdiL (CAAX protease family)
MVKFIRQHSVISYFILACAISWLCLLPIIGIDGFLGRTTLSDERMPLLFIAMCAGPTISGLLLIYVMDGKSGLKDLGVKLFKWKIKFRFYLIALFTAPILLLLSYFSLSLFSSKFIPTIFASDDVMMLIIGGIVGGIAAGLCEEIGWTGFVTPQLRTKYSIITTGLLLGVVWGFWHFPLFMKEDPDGQIPLLILLMGSLITHLPAFRILMTWVYDRTRSLLIAVLMHMSFTASTLIFQAGINSGIDIILSNMTLTLLLYLAIIILNTLTKGHLTRGVVLNDMQH